MVLDAIHRGTTSLIQWFLPPMIQQSVMHTFSLVVTHADETEVGGTKHACTRTPAVDDVKHCFMKDHLR